MDTAIKPAIEINFMHGWGFTSQIWHDWAMPVFDQVIDKKLERGYFGPVKIDCDFASPGLRILIVHSFGLHIAPKELFKKLDLLVIISGFSTFLTNTNNDRAKKKMLALMQRKFSDEPLAVLTEFYKSCGIKSNYQTFLPQFDKINLDLLQADLQILATSSFDLNLLKSIPRILLLHGEKDSIVDLAQSKEMQSKLPNSSILIIPEGEHALPILNSAQCRELVESAIICAQKSSGVEAV